MQFLLVKDIPLGQTARLGHLTIDIFETNDGWDVADAPLGPEDVGLVSPPAAGVFFTLAMGGGHLSGPGQSTRAWEDREDKISWNVLGQLADLYHSGLGGVTGGEGGLNGGDCREGGRTGPRSASGRPGTGAQWVPKAKEGNKERHGTYEQPARRDTSWHPWWGR